MDDSASGRLAADLLARAERDEQATHRIDPADGIDIAALRAEIRRLARQQGLRVRTGIVEDDVLAVIRTDARLWTESTATMRAKLTPPD